MLESDTHMFAKFQVSIHVQTLWLHPPLHGLSVLAVPFTTLGGDIFPSS